MPDGLSPRHPQLPALVVGIAEDEVHVFTITVQEGRSKVTPSRIEQEVAEVGSQVNSNPVTQFAVQAREYDLPSLPTKVVPDSALSRFRLRVQASQWFQGMTPCLNSELGD